MNEKRMLKENDHQDIKTLLTPPAHTHPKPVKKRKKDEEPPLHPIFNTKISLTLNEHAPFQSILTDVCEKIGISILMDHTIKDSVHYIAKNKPFIEVIEDLTDSLHLRFTIKNKFIKIEKDTAYPKTYHVHFLKFERESSNNISSTTDISDEQDKRHYLKNNSDSAIQVKSSIHFWDEVEKGLRFYLGKDTFHINQQSGIISVIATDKQHKFIKTYLEKLEKITNTQVLIEVKIIQVKLRQEFKAGIDLEFFEKALPPGHAPMQPSWNIGAKGTDHNILNFKGANFSLLLKALETFGSIRTVSSPRIVLLNNQTSMIKVAENHIFFKIDYQTQYLGLVENPKTNEEREKLRTMSTSEIKSKPIGFIMPIQASIQKDTGKILLFVRPTISRKSGEIDDPALEFNARGAKIKKEDMPKSKIPIVEVREMDSVLKLDDGDTAILGGFMEVHSNDHSVGLMKPGMLDPVKSALGSETLTEEVSELLFLFRATIIDDDNKEEWDNPADTRLQRDFVKDARPFQ